MLTDGVMHMHKLADDLGTDEFQSGGKKLSGQQGFAFGQKDRCNAQHDVVECPSIKKLPGQIAASLNPDCPPAGCQQNGIQMICHMP